MNKVTYILVIIILSISCNYQTDNEVRIRKFEKFMGPEMTNAINRASDLLDSIVIHNSIYKKDKLDSAYYYFLTRLADNQIKLDELIIDTLQLNQLKRQVKSSGLYDELFLKLKDAYIKNGTIISIHEYVPKDSTKAVSTVEGETLIPKDLDIDSALADVKSSRETNYDNRYIQGLTLVMDNDSLIKDYLVTKKAVGQISPNSIAAWILYENENFSDYFVKRILAVELLL